MNQNSAVVTIVAVVLMLISLGVIIMSLSGNRYTPRIVDVYFMDISDGSLFTEKSDLLSPIDAPSGENKGVRAFVFSCGECSDEESHFVGWLEMYTPQAKKIMTAPAPIEGAEGDPIANEMDMFEAMERGHLVSDASGKKWVPANSEKGFRVMEQIQTKCDGQPPKPCFPGR